MKGKTKTIGEAIRIEAYLLSEKAGHPAGMEHYFWTQAEGIVHARATAVSVAVKAAAVTPAAKRATKPKAAAKPVAETKPKVVVKPEAVVAEPVVAVKPKIEAKPKTVKKPALNGTNGKAHQLSLNAEMSAPTPKRAAKK